MTPKRMTGHELGEADSKIVGIYGSFGDQKVSHLDNVINKLLLDCGFLLFIDGRIITMNQAAVEVFHKKRHMLIGETLDSMNLSGENVEELRAAAKVGRSGEFSVVYTDTAKRETKLMMHLINEMSLDGKKAFALVVEPI